MENGEVETKQIKRERINKMIRSIILAFGFCAVGSEGPYFPLANFLALGMIVFAMYSLKNEN